MIKLDLSQRGAPRLQAWLIAAPRRAEADLVAFVEKGTALLGAGVRANTPVRTGRLLGSQQSKVEAVVGGARGIVFTSLRYARYVEHGTREHGRAQLPYRLGAITAKPEIEHLANELAERIVDSL